MLNSRRPHPIVLKENEKINSKIVSLRNRFGPPEDVPSGISRLSRAVTEKKCTKKCDARAELLFWLLSLLLFDVLVALPLPLPSSSSRKMLELSYLQ